MARYSIYQSNTELVKDSITGLMWLNQENPPLLTWADAVFYIDQLNSTASEGHGYNDWKLPLVQQNNTVAYPAELDSLVRKDGKAKQQMLPSKDSPYESPSLTGAGVFKKVNQDQPYWSKTDDVHDASKVFVVWMSNGIVELMDKSSVAYVWPVRGGKTLTIDRGESRLFKENRTGSEANEDWRRGSNSYTPGAKVEIRARPAPGTYFKRWIGGDIVQRNKRMTTLIMPDNNLFLEFEAEDAEKALVGAAALYYFVGDITSLELETERSRVFSTFDLQIMPVIPQTNNKYELKTCFIDSYANEQEFKRIGRAAASIFEPAGETHHVKAYICPFISDYREDKVAKVLGEAKTDLDFYKAVSDYFGEPYCDEASGTYKRKEIAYGNKYKSLIIFTPKVHTITWVPNPGVWNWFVKHRPTTLVANDSLPIPPSGRIAEALLLTGQMLDPVAPWDPPIVVATEDTTYYANLVKQAKIAWDKKGGDRVVQTGSTALSASTSSSPTTSWSLDWFGDWLGDIFYSLFSYGTLPVAPEITKEGYSLKWEPPISIITGDRLYTANWIPEFSVTIKGKVIVGYELTVVPSSGTLSGCSIQWSISTETEGVFVDIDIANKETYTILSSNYTHVRSSFIKVTVSDALNEHTVSAITSAIAPALVYYSAATAIGTYNITTRNLARYCDNGTIYSLTSSLYSLTNRAHGTVTDIMSKRMWTRDLGISCTWEDLPARVAEVNANNYEGYSDWRIPTTEEFAVNFISLNSMPFRQGGRVWTSGPVSLDWRGLVPVVPTFATFNGAFYDGNIYFEGVDSYGPYIINSDVWGVYLVRNTEYEPAITITSINNIIGTVRVGEEITAGNLVPAKATAFYQWKICDTVDGIYTDIIRGTNTKQLVLREEDVFKFIKVTATGNNDSLGIVTSKAKQVLPAKLIEIFITENAFVLSYEIGSSLDITGLVIAGKFSDGSQENYLTITEDDITGFDSSKATTGQVLTITKTLNGVSCSTTYLVDILATRITYIEIIGLPVVGETLSVSYLTPANATVSYQWLSSDRVTGTYGEIPGATSSTYTLVESDETRSIKLVVTGIGNFRDTLESAPISLRYHDNSDGTVTDTQTGLMWSQDANHGRKTWVEAQLYVTELNASGYMGYNDWRLPSVNTTNNINFGGGTHPAELDALSRTDAPIPTGWFIRPSFPFLYVQSHIYWSRTTYSQDIDLAWAVDMNNGNTGIAPNKSETHYVWLVRG